jgi:glutaminyl-tRNA synthetase
VLLTETEPKSRDFIHTIIDEHLRTGAYDGRVVTRFPPEPNGFLHIGHAKSICLNFGLAQDYAGGVCHLRLDDTDPTKEDMKYVESIQRDVRWLGFEWGEKLFYASDYFERLYDYAVALIQAGKAYVCSLNEKEIREYRGNLTTPGKDSPYRTRSIADNLDLFQKMKAGEFPDGAHVLRAKIDMANPNMKMRDPLLYRIRHANHYRKGTEWCIYPMYDFAHCLSDSMERITHSICTLEFENNRELYDWILEACDVPQPRPKQYEFARLNLNYTVMSKRKLLELVETKQVTGWDDPRLPTISGMRRRGYTPEAIRAFCKSIGMAKANSTVDMAQLEFFVRDDLNPKVPRVLAVLNPLKLVIDNYPEASSEKLDASYYPHDVPLEGARPLPFSKTLYIEADDFMENPPKNYYRLSPGAEVRLRHAYIIRCERVEKDSAGNITEIGCVYDPQTKSGDPAAVDRKVKGTIHWVSSEHAIPAEVRLYDRLYQTEAPEETVSGLNPDSLITLKQCYLEPSLNSAKSGDRFQFERQGYFCVDSEDSKPGALVFNRIVALKDSWGKDSSKKETVTSEPISEKPALEKKAAKVDSVSQKQTMAKTVFERTPEQEALAKKWQSDFAIKPEEAVLLSETPELAAYFESAANVSSNPKVVATWMVNELLRELKETPISDLKPTPHHLAELVNLMEEGVLSGKMAKTVFECMLASGDAPDAISKTQGLQQISDASVLLPWVQQVIQAHPDNVSKYKEGKTSMLGFLVGQVIQLSKGNANPKLVNTLILQELEK